MRPPLSDALASMRGAAPPPVTSRTADVRVDRARQSQRRGHQRARQAGEIEPLNLHVRAPLLARQARVDGDALAIGSERQTGHAGRVAQADARGTDQRPRRLRIADRERVDGHHPPALPAAADVDAQRIRRGDGGARVQPVAGRAHGDGDGTQVAVADRGGRRGHVGVDRLGSAHIRDDGAGGELPHARVTGAQRGEARRHAQRRRATGAGDHDVDLPVAGDRSRRRVVVEPQAARRRGEIGGVDHGLAADCVAVDAAVRGQPGAGQARVDPHVPAHRRRVELAA